MFLLTLNCVFFAGTFFDSGVKRGHCNVFLSVCGIRKYEIVVWNVVRNAYARSVILGSVYVKKHLYVFAKFFYSVFVRLFVVAKIAYRNKFAHGGRGEARNVRHNERAEILPCIGAEKFFYFFAVGTRDFILRRKFVFYGRKKTAFCSGIVRSLFESVGDTSFFVDEQNIAVSSHHLRNEHIIDFVVQFVARGYVEAYYAVAAKHDDAFYRARGQVFSQVHAE